MILQEGGGRVIRHSALRWDRGRGLVRAVPEDAHAWRDFFPGWVFGDEMPSSEKHHSLEIYPVPNRSDAQWVISAQWRDSMGALASKGAAGMVRIGAAVSGEILKTHLLEWKLESRATGVFAVRKAIVAPDGTLAVPGYQISIEGGVRESLIGADFQGFLQDEDEVVPVVDFMGFKRGVWAPLFPKYGRICGFLLWGGSRRETLWVTWTRPDAYLGDIVPIDLDAMTAGELVRDVRPGSAYSLPDGRWAALVVAPKSDEGMFDLLVGKGRKMAIISRNEIGFDVYELRGVYPLSGSEWLVVANEGLIVLDGLRLADRVQISTNVVAVFDTHVITGEIGGFYVIPARDIHVADLPRLVHTMDLNGIRVSKPLGCAWFTPGRYLDEICLLFLPSEKLVTVDWSGIWTTPQLDAGMEGYLLLDRQERRVRLRRFDPSGKEVEPVLMEEGVELEQVSVIPVGRRCFLLVIRPHARREADGVVLKTVDMGGQTLGEVRLADVPPRLLFIRRVWNDTDTRAFLRFYDQNGNRGSVGQVSVFDDGRIEFRFVHDGLEG